MNLAGLAQLAHEQGALLVVDGYQALGSEAIDVRSTGIDCLVSGVMKFLLGTYGLGFLYVREELAERLQPSNSGWYGQADREAFEIERLDYADGALRFQTGSPTIAAIYAADAAIRLLEDVGWPAIRSHVVELGDRLIHGALERGWVVRTPTDAEQRGAIVSVAWTDAASAVRALADQGIVCGQRDGALRIALHYYNTADDVEALLSGLDAIRDHEMKG
jgi:selenocysteine lyase/cysteine desulfurase